VHGQRTPHGKLVVVQNLLAAGKARATVSALAGGAALTLRDFYKSMTTHADHRIWQDVYRPKTPAGDVYRHAQYFLHLQR